MEYKRCKFYLAFNQTPYSKNRLGTSKVIGHPAVRYEVTTRHALSAFIRVLTLSGKGKIKDFFSLFSKTLRAMSGKAVIAWKRHFYPASSLVKSQHKMRLLFEFVQLSLQSIYFTLLLGNRSQKRNRLCKDFRYFIEQFKDFSKTLNTHIRSFSAPAGLRLKRHYFYKQKIRYIAYMRVASKKISND